MGTLEHTLQSVGLHPTSEGGRLVVDVNGKKLPAQSCEVAILFLARVCNYASTWDGAGFSKFDAQWGHTLADNVKRYGRFTEKQLACVQRQGEPGGKGDGLILKYRKQLTKAGFDLEQLLDQAPPPPREKKEPAEVVIVEGVIRSESKKAWKVFVKGQFVWMPKSQVKTEIHNAAGDCTCVVPAWLAKEKGIAA